MRLKQMAAGPVCRVLAAAANDGRCELQDFLEEIGRDDPAARAKMAAFLERAADRGPPRNPEQFRPLKGSDGVFEFKPKPYRIFCFFDGRQIIVCTHAFKKKTNIRGDIQNAERLKTEYFEAKETGNIRVEE
ncbi:MAG: type II toxin-antitoxin system RelE/ParE family toxin [Deferrisomatales bacterium]|nr:type II toxin-antitoxin system RelE/ParE family toxin [Deferrisomatales bacterium]